MDLRERFYYAQQEFHKQTRSYYEILYRIEAFKINSYLFDTAIKTLTKIEQPKSDYEIWILKRIEEIKVNVFGQWNINLNNQEYESKGL